MQFGVWSRVVSKFQAAVFAVMQSVAPATGMFVVLPQFVTIAFCSIATDQLCGDAAAPVETTRTPSASVESLWASICNTAELLKTARTPTAPARISDFFMSVLILSS